MTRLRWQHNPLYEPNGEFIYSVRAEGGAETYACHSILTEIVDSVEGIILQVREIFDEEFDMCSSNGLKRRMLRMCEVNETSKCVPALYTM